ncbi:Glu/Leu/Phe/Val dehydrogenase family protein [Agrobacterium salinitolerans]|uniref:Glu/Leu/Phe/Val dehydrogenase family protein n=1 Tax=Agrobacterium salinitolerans TaxID=1183413 RepID=UPI001574DD8A|nr:Glu/Leu/Phe/Val dehydrogenase [Agrobacterium salinitolerans]NTA40187.1 Glu/Leu/Phe/Val dehydrogenase [Agrobacterium salinitolerans]
MEIATHTDFDDHEMVLYCTDKATGLRAFIAIHNTTLGLGMGGCRMKAYGSDAEALSDVLRLSRGMTYKYAASGLEHGGAKAVIIDDFDAGRRTERLLAFGRIIERLRGLYTTAEDAGISTADVRLMSSATRHVRNLPLEDGGEGALCTAWGVFHGIQAALEFRGFSDLAGRTVAVEGLGKVGMALCELLKNSGADLIVYDLDEQKVRAAQQKFGAAAAAPGQIHLTDADVYSPCALGGTLSQGTIPEIQAKIIAGAANNQLSTPSQDKLLWDRGVTYCPDYIVNAGGVLSVARRGAQFDLGEALARVATIRDTTQKVLALSKAEGIPTGEAADRLARRRLQA